MEETVATRLKLFIDTNGLSTTQFADMCGIPRPTLSQLLTGRNKKVSDQLIRQIHNVFPDLSVVWLLFGEGPVKVAASANGSSAAPAQANSKKTGGEESYGVSSGQNQDANRPKILHTYTSAAEYSTENGLKGAENSGNYSKNDQFETEMKIMDLQRQIENLRQNPRKVLQITIYYDDSTFETFTPKGR